MSDHSQAIECAADAIVELGPNPDARKQAEAAIEAYMDAMSAAQDRREAERHQETFDRATALAKAGAV
jgi:hypothetical protein